MDNNIIKINLVEVADRLATLELLDNHVTSEELDLMEESDDEEGIFVWKEGIQEEYNKLYDYYYILLSELEVVEV
jgi:hypothetical protein